MIYSIPESYPFKHFRLINPSNSYHVVETLKISKSCFYFLLFVMFGHILSFLLPVSQLCPVKLNNNEIYFDCDHPGRVGLWSHGSYMVIATKWSRMLLLCTV